MSDTDARGRSTLARIRVESSVEHESALLLAVRGAQLARGPHLGQLEERLAALLGKRYAVLTVNGFAALFAALRARKLTPGTPVRTAAAGTCFAMVNAIRAADLTAEFTDLEQDSLSLALPIGAATIAIAPDHFGRIADAARDYRPSPGRFMIEDAAQAFFSRGQVPTKADAVVLSFYPTKWIDGIDGGAVLTDDASLYDEMRRVVSYVDQVEHESAARFNLAMPNLHAAYALASLERSESVVARLRAAHESLARAATGCGLIPLAYRQGEVPSRCVLRAASREHRDRVLSGLARQGVQASRELLMLCPPKDAALYPAAMQLVDHTLSLPFHPYLIDDEIQRVVRALQRSGDE
jgi:dTDP-4-amino-4,6-dideoxygalactose transaminase